MNKDHNSTPESHDVTLESSQHSHEAVLTPTGESRINRAIEDDDLKTLSSLLDNGADPNALDNSGNLPLQLAAARGQIDCIDLLFGYGANPNRRDRKGNTAVHIAARCHQSDALIRLIRHDGDVNMPNLHGETALHSAVRGMCWKKPDPRIFEILIAAGAWQNVVDGYGVTPSQIAKEEGFDAVARLLTANPACPGSHRTT
ncbi:MAG: ankyrin repeat domain-containing protein [Planctomycetaceae bacterium]